MIGPGGLLLVVVLPACVCSPSFSCTSGCPWPKATVKPPVWNPGPKIEIPHPENHVLKVFRFRSWKPRVWKSRPQSWDPKSWKPCPENHILKFPRPESWDPKFWKPCPENHILKSPRSFCLAALPCLSDRQTDIVDEEKLSEKWLLITSLSGCSLEQKLSSSVTDSPDRTRLVTPFFRSALECPNLNFAYRLGTGNSALRLAPGPGN
jgi:hypothetical protein